MAFYILLAPGRSKAFRMSKLKQGSPLFYLFYLLVMSSACKEVGYSSTEDTESTACCPRDETFYGCINLGGADLDGCHETCDFWCATNWQVKLDEYGCEVWRYDLRDPLPGEDDFCIPETDTGDAIDIDAGEKSDTESSGSDAPDTEESIECCPRDKNQGGCMNLGGADLYGCYEDCDFWCSTNWHVELDEYGCEVWSYDIRDPLPGEDDLCFMKLDAGTDTDMDSGISYKCETLVDPCLDGDGGANAICRKGCLGLTGIACDEEGFDCAMLTPDRCSTDTDSKTDDPPLGLCVPLEKMACESDADCCFLTERIDGLSVGWCAGAINWRCESSQCELRCEC